MTVTINGTTGIAGTNGSAGTPAVQGEDTNTGIFFPAADTVAVATAGTERLRVTSAGSLLMNTTAVPTSSLIRQVVAGDGAYSQWTRTSTTLGGGYVGTDGAALIFGTHTGTVGSETYTERARIDGSGNMQVGVTSSVDAARLTVRSAQTDFSGSALRVQNGNQSNLFYVQNDGNINAGAITTSTGTSLVMTASGFIVKSSSSLRYKKDVEPIDIGLDFVLGLQPVKYNLKDSDTPQVGFIAEDFPDTRLVSESLIDIDDPSKGLQREGVNYANLVAPLVKAIQEQQALITDLTARVAELEAK